MYIYYKIYFFRNKSIASLTNVYTHNPVTDSEILLSGLPSLIGFNFFMNNVCMGY